MSGAPHAAQRDGFESWVLAVRLIALRRGSVRPATPCEMYWQEMHGVIP